MIAWRPRWPFCVGMESERLHIVQSQTMATPWSSTTTSRSTTRDRNAVTPPALRHISVRMVSRGNTGPRTSPSSRSTATGRSRNAFAGLRAQPRSSAKPVQNWPGKAGPLGDVGIAVQGVVVARQPIDQCRLRQRRQVANRVRRRTWAKFHALLTICWVSLDMLRRVYLVNVTNPSDSRNLAASRTWSSVIDQPNSLACEAKSSIRTAPFCRPSMNFVLAAMDNFM